MSGMKKKATAETVQGLPQGELETTVTRTTARREDAHGVKRNGESNGARNGRIGGWDSWRLGGDAMVG